MQPHDTVLLDVDGTLADSSYHLALAWHSAFARQDLPTAIWRLHRAIGMGGDKLVAEVSGADVEVSGADVEARHGDALRRLGGRSTPGCSGGRSAPRGTGAPAAPARTGLDTPYDVASAARMGAPCVVVRSGGFGAAELESAGAVLVVAEPADLLDADWAALARSTPPTRAARTHSPLPG